MPPTLRKQLLREQGRSEAPDLSADLMAIGASLPDLDTRSADEIGDYDEGGLW